MLHDLKEFNYADETIDADVLIFGHSHKSMIEERDGVLHLNPGSAGPRRFKLPVTIARLNVEGQVSAEIIPLL
jgi:putative phosphoesterase